MVHALKTGANYKRARYRKIDQEDTRMKTFSSKPNSFLKQRGK